MLMWPWGTASRALKLQHRALSLTPTGGIRLEGFWTISEETSNGPVLSTARLVQHGASVEGWMQCKLAAAHPIAIRGVVSDGTLIGTWARPYDAWIGSGILRLAVIGEGLMEGTGTWFSPDLSG